MCYFEHLFIGICVFSCNFTISELILGLCFLKHVFEEILDFSMVLLFRRLNSDVCSSDELLQLLSLVFKISVDSHLIAQLQNQIVQLST